jgi:preprotein translocase subunit SecY
MSLQQSRGSFLLTSELFSVVGLGVMPLLSALLLLEWARLASSRFNAWAAATPDNARRLERYAYLGAALLAAAQAYGIANGLEAAPDILVKPGLVFRVGTVATLVAGTVLLMWLATMISRYGLGSGIWVMLLAPQLDGLHRLVLAMLELVRTAVIPVAVPLVLLACVVVAVAALAALGLTLKRLGRPLDRVLIWPFYLAGLPASILIIAPLALPDGPLRDGLAVLSPEKPLYLAAVAAIVIAVFLAQWRRTEPQRASAEPSTPPASNEASPVLLTALALAALAVVPALLSTSFDLRISLNGRWIAMLVVVALPIVGLLRREPA